MLERYEGFWRAGGGLHVHRAEALAAQDDYAELWAYEREVPPPRRTRRGLDRKHDLLRHYASQQPGLTLAQLAQQLFETGIYRAVDRRTGHDKPIHTGTLQRLLATG